MDIQLTAVIRAILSILTVISGALLGFGLHLGQSGYEIAIVGLVMMVFIEPAAYKIKYVFGILVACTWVAVAVVAYFI